MIEFAIYGLAHAVLWIALSVQHATDALTVEAASAHEAKSIEAIDSAEKLSSGDPVAHKEQALSEKPVDSKASKGDDEPSKELKYETHMAIAKAYEGVNEKSKAIDAYEKAILAAPNPQAKDAAKAAVASLRDLEDSSWLQPVIGQVQSVWAWVALGLLGIPLVLLRRVGRWIANCFRSEKQFRILVTSVGGGLEAAHFCNLIQQAHDASREQLLLIQRIGKRSAVTILTFIRPHSLVTQLPMNLPTVLANKWWTQTVLFLGNWLDPPFHTVDLSIMQSKNSYGLYVRLTVRRGAARHWQEMCTDSELAVTMANLAYEVIANINHRERTGDYVH